ncbi:TetR/AcrR family transcriptional regulator [Kiloniella laminariae]|uniref:TetR/AcrR family transcriptional regulator n=1 Tax=Kiloniella laminariae TaxID=454162 RepID=UPI0012FBA18A|nr:TetR/AcrR family transcriptional regulator [Kiloniella laminariae]
MKTSFVKQKKLVKRRLPTQQRSRESVRRILDAGANLLTSISLDRLTTRRIAEVAEVNIASLYQFFPNKEAIILALYEQWLDEVGAALDATEGTFPPEKTDVALFWENIFRALSSTKTSATVKDRLQRAMGTNKDLAQLDLIHSQVLTERMAGYMKQQGATLPDRELNDLALLLFHFERAQVAPLSQVSGETRARMLDAGQEALLRIVRGAFSSPV